MGGGLHHLHARPLLYQSISLSVEFMAHMSLDPAEDYLLVSSQLSQGLDTVPDKL